MQSLMLVQQTNNGVVKVRDLRKETNLFLAIINFQFNLFSFIFIVARNNVEI